MNQKQRKINQNLKIIDPSYHFRKGVIKVNIHNTLEHELAKFLVAMELMRSGSCIYTEVIFLNGKRADIYDASVGMAFEVVHTETINSIERKKKEYPCKLSFLRVDSILKGNGVKVL